ncbi:MAG TPA: hypothetical protein VML95_04060 [Longimicrobiales bacterium]|nr:hypothetical protein [Longimicrobiales bacterium]
MESTRSPGKRWGRLAAAVLLAAPLACGDRARPTGLADDPGEVDLSVELLAPEQGEVRMAGTTIPISVQASEPAGRLTGVGFEARRNNFERDLLDSAQVAFAAVPDAIVAFEYAVPADFTNNAQIDIYGVAFGQSGTRVVSVPRSTLIIR